MGMGLSMGLRSGTAGNPFMPQGSGSGPCDGLLDVCDEAHSSGSSAGFALTAESGQHGSGEDHFCPGWALPQVESEGALRALLLMLDPNWQALPEGH